MVNIICYYRFEHISYISRAGKVNINKQEIEMFRLLVIFSGIIVLTSGTAKAETALEASKKVVKKAENEKIEQKVCPVMGGKIDPELYYTYKGQKIYVCCPGCISAIKKDPEKYLKKVQKDIEAARKKSAAEKKDVKKSAK